MEAVLEQLPHDAVRELALEFDAARAVDGEATLLGHPGQLGEESAFPDAGLALYQEDPSGSGAGGVEFDCGLRQLPLSVVQRARHPSRPCGASGGASRPVARFAARRVHHRFARRPRQLARGFIPLLRRLGQRPRNDGGQVDRHIGKYVGGRGRRVGYVRPERREVALPAGMGRARSGTGRGRSRARRRRRERPLARRGAARARRSRACRPTAPARCRWPSTCASS